MLENKGYLRPRIVMSSLLLLFSAASAFAQTPSFTYQGRLTDGGTPANGNYDLTFALWDSLSGGTQIGSTQTLNTVAVSDGVFTVSLDFGANAFTGASRFLEISARPTGGSFTLLTPRQQVTSTPYAIRSANASSADTATNATNATTATNATQLGGVSASQYVQTNDSRLSDPRPPTPGSSNYIQNSASTQASSNFNISGNGTAGGMLSSNLVNATTQYNLNGSRILSNPGDQNLFAGASAGAANTTGFRNSFFGSGAGQKSTTGALNSFFGVQAGLNNTTGNFNAFFGDSAGSSNSSGFFNSFFGINAGPINGTGDDNAFFGESAGVSNTFGSSNAFFGSNAGQSNTGGDNNTAIGFRADVVPGPIFNPTNATAIGYRAQVTASNSLVLGSIKNINGATASTNVGIGTTSPVYRLTVEQNTASTYAAHIYTSGLAAGTSYGLTVSGGTNASDVSFTARNQAGTDLLFVRGDGRVGIGTIAPDRLLTVNGDASKSAGGTTWQTFSDERLKNTKGAFTPGLNALLKLQPIRFQYKPDNALGLPGGGEEVGFSAQAVEKVLPEAVSRTQQGYLQLHSDPILWTMLNAIKEQQVQIQRQQKQIEGLKKLVCRSRPRTLPCR
jgi:hypothetical protein